MDALEPDINKLSFLLIYTANFQKKPWTNVVSVTFPSFPFIFLVAPSVANAFNFKIIILFSNRSALLWHSLINSCRFFWPIKQNWAIKFWFLLWLLYQLIKYIAIMFQILVKRINYFSKGINQFIYTSFFKNNRYCFCSDEI